MYESFSFSSFDVLPLFVDMKKTQGAISMQIIKAEWASVRAALNVAGKRNDWQRGGNQWRYLPSSHQVAVAGGSLVPQVSST